MRKISHSRDVQWLNKNYGEWKGIKATNRTTLTETVVLEISENENENDDGGANDDGGNNANGGNNNNNNAPGSPIPVRARREVSYLGRPDGNLRRTRRQTRIATANS